MKLAYLFGSLLLLLQISCREKQKTTPPISNPEGFILAKQYCQSCHELPKPEELDVSTWRNEVLPTMGPRLGIHTRKSTLIEEMKGLNIFPQKPLVSREEWLQIMDYYLNNSPLLAKPALIKQEVSLDLPLFDVQIPQLDLAPMTTLLQFVKEKLYIGNSNERALFSITQNNVLSKGMRLPGSPSFLHETPKGLYVLTMGQVMPHNEKTGSLNFIPSKNGLWEEPLPLLNDLQRPVHASIADLDQDGNDDMVIACFGNLVGELLLINDVHSPKRTQKVLRALPGALKSEIWDFNRDGLPDILALMAQGEEGFFLYENLGKGEFSEKKILSFPASFGSTYFELLDFNKDGWQDILYVNGDNGDYFPVMKKHHGIRLFLNNKGKGFTEDFFIQHNGAFKTETHDFDGDGDLDIASISYFPNYKYSPQESFIYFENMGNETFEVRSFKESTVGKWLTLEAGDIDGDADMDIILGSAFFMNKEVPNSLQKKWRNQAPALIILKNQLLHGEN